MRREAGVRSFPRTCRAATAVSSLPDGDPDPYGAILVGPGVAPERYFIAEEEVPRAGRIVTRAFQRTRWLDGRVLLWLGRQTETGRGEGTSGLEFDVIEEVPQR